MGEQAGFGSVEAIVVDKGVTYAVVRLAGCRVYPITVKASRFETAGVEPVKGALFGAEYNPEGTDEASVGVRGIRPIELPSFVGFEDSRGVNER